MIGMYCKDIEPKPVRRLCICWACVLLIQSYALQANADETSNEFQLPDISYSPVPLEKEEGFWEKAEDTAKLLEQKFKHYTRVKITNDSALQLRRKGFRIETQYGRDISTEFEADSDGEVSFKIETQYRYDISTEIEAQGDGDVNFSIKVPF